MGAASNGRCYPSQVEAAQAECAAYPRSVASADGVVTWSCSGVADDGSSLAVVRHGTDGVVSSASIAVSYAPCDETMQYSDAVTMWGLGATAIVTVFVVKKFVYRLVANQ
jgi:hypothetical protein